MRNRRSGRPRRPPLLTLSRGYTFRRYSGSPVEARFTPSEGVGRGRLRRPENAVPTAGAKRGQGHRMVPLPPLDSPKTLLCAATPFGRAAKRELRGLGSGRRADFGTLSGPEVSLRKPQRCQCAAIRCRAQTPSLRPTGMMQISPGRKKSTDLRLCSFG